MQDVGGELEMTIINDNRFNYCIPIILKWEGGYVNDPNDPGGETKYGISKASYPHLDISSLTENDAEQIYYTDYWIPSGCKFAPPKLDLYLFNCAVNQGVGESIRLVQSLIGTTPDGNMGPISQSKLLHFPPGNSYMFLTLCAQRYAENPNFSRYGKGWFNRLFDLATNY